MAIAERRFKEEKWGPFSRKVEVDGPVLSANTQVSLGGTKNLSSPMEGLLGVIKSTVQVELFREADGVLGPKVGSIYGDEINRDGRTKGRLRYFPDEDLRYLR